MSEKFVLALDQGTTSSRAILFDLHGRERRRSSRELRVHFPNDGWVEQDADEIWRTQWEAMREVAEGVEDAIVSLGITNQRETTVVWERKTGKILAPAIVWQCRRSAPICEEWKSLGLSEKVSETTGLVIDPYFSATKIAWLLRNVARLRDAARRGEAVFGTVDSWLLFKLTQGKEFATDKTNASRTLLYNINNDSWDDELLRLVGLRAENLAEVKSSDAEFGETSLLGPRIPVRAILGDQHASLFGHECWELGEGKCTFGTGAFLLVNCGTEKLVSKSGLLSTIAWEHEKGFKSFALEGSVFVAGSLIQWMRDKLGMFSDAAASEKLASQVENSGGVILVPAFVGLGAPYWEEHARGAIFGLTRDTSPSHLARAALEAVCHEVADLIELPELSKLKKLRVDGGMAQNTLFCQLLADFAQVSIHVAPSPEITAKGAAAMSAFASVFGGDFDAFKSSFFGDEQVNTVYQPRAAPVMARKAWKSAVSGLIGIARAK